MARANPIDNDPEISELIKKAGDGMMLLITRAMWDTLVLQAKHENTSPGSVLDKALKYYLEKNASQEVVDFLFKISGG